MTGCSASYAVLEADLSRWKIIRRNVCTAVGVIVASKDLANRIHKPKFSIRSKLLLIFHAMDAIKRKKK